MTGKKLPNSSFSDSLFISSDKRFAMSTALPWPRRISSNFGRMSSEFDRISSIFGRIRAFLSSKAKMFSSSTNPLPSFWFDNDSTVSSRRPFRGIGSRDGLIYKRFKQKSNWHNFTFIIKIWWRYCNKICVYDEYLLAGRDLQCRAPNSRSRYTAPFDDIKIICEHVKRVILTFLI